MFRLSFKPRTSASWLDFPGFGAGKKGEVVRVRLRPPSDFALASASAAARGLLPLREMDEPEEDWLERLAQSLDRQGLTARPEALADSDRRRGVLSAAIEVLTDRFLFEDLAEAWEGVGETGSDAALAIEPRSVRAFLSAHGGYARIIFRRWVFAEHEAGQAEGNGSAPLPPGSGGEGATSAGDAGTMTPPAHEANETPAPKAGTAPSSNTP